MGITCQPYPDFAELKRRRGERLDNPAEPEPESPPRLRPDPLRSPAKFYLREHPVPVSNNQSRHPATARFLLRSLCLRNKNLCLQPQSPKSRSSRKGTGSPVPKSKPQMRALAPEVRFESFNLYAIALEHEGQLTNQRSNLCPRIKTAT